MRAFALRGPRRLEPIDIPVPEPGPFQVRVKVAYVGVCGSDLEVYLGHRRPEFLLHPPMLGHEPSGVIDKIGEHVTGLKVGDQVTARNTWGCFTDYVLCAPEHVMKLLPEIPLIEGSLVEVVPGVMMAATRTGITAAHDVLVLGTGLSGLQIVRMVRLNGCKRLIAADLFQEKLALAREFGADVTINVQKEDLAARIEEIVPGGVDVTIVATLTGNDVAAALDYTRSHGTVVLYGGIGPCDGIDFFKQHRKAINIIKETRGMGGVIESRRLWREAMQLVADGILNTKRLRTHVLPMEQLPEAMELRAEPRPDVIHVLLENPWAKSEREASGQEFGMIHA